MVIKKYWEMRVIIPAVKEGWKMPQNLEQTLFAKGRAQEKVS